MADSYLLNPMSMNSGAQAMLPFYDANAVAQNQAAMLNWQQRAQMLQQMMQAPVVPGGGRKGAAVGILGGVLSALANNQNNAKLADILKDQFQIQNQAASAKRQQDLEDEQRKLQEDIYKATQIARGEGAAKKEFALKEAVGGGAFIMDPATGQLTVNPDFNKTQLELAQGKAKIEAANRQGPADPFRDIKAGVAAGIISPEQAMQAMQSKLLGNGQSAPSGYQWNGPGALQPIPGGPADPNQVKPKPLSEAAANALAKINNSIANAKEYQRRVVGKNGEFNDVASMLGDTPQLYNSAIQDMLYAKSGANAPAAEVDKAFSMYGPSRVAGIPIEKDTTASAKVGNFIRDMERMRDQYTQGTTAAGLPEPQAFGAAASVAQPTQTAINAQGQRIGLINGQWVPL